MSKPSILILTTGGTIASRTDDVLREGPELIQALPQLMNFGNIEVQEFARIGSSKMTPEHWLQLSKKIQKTINQRPELTCIIVTHGTDTMEETAFFLHLTVRTKIPIVLVGSMRSSNEVSADGPANLLNAVRVGISDKAIGMGVLVVLNENIQSGRDLQKVDNRRVDAFAPTEVGFLGFADPEKVTFYRTPSKPHTYSSPFDISSIEQLPNVELVKDYAGFDPSILTYFLERHNDGLVISSFAGGRLSHGFDALSDLSGFEKPIVISSSIRGGRIMGTNQEKSPVIIANDLPPNKARILLMLALTLSSDSQEIQRVFDTY